MINLDLLDLDLENRDAVYDASVASAVTHNLLIPNKQVSELCSKFDEAQQHLFSFIMQYAVHCKLSEKNNE